MDRICVNKYKCHIGQGNSIKDLKDISKFMFLQKLSYRIMIINKVYDYKNHEMYQLPK